MKYDADEVKQMKKRINKVLLIVFFVNLLIPNLLGGVIIFLIILACIFKTNIAYYLIDHKKSESDQKQPKKETEQQNFEQAVKEEAEKDIDVSHIADIRDVHTMRDFYRSIHFISDQDLRVEIAVNKNILEEAVRLSDNIQGNLNAAFEPASLSYSKFGTTVERGFDAIVENSAMIARKANAYKAYADEKLISDMKERIQNNQDLLKKISSVNANLIDIAAKNEKEKENRQSIQNLDDLIHESELYK